MITTMKIYVGVTDTSWFEFLTSRPDIDEVNFWQPSGGRRFAALDPGDLFLFKLHYPINMIVGGGTFVRHARFPAWFAWETFKEKNGAASYPHMRARIERYKHKKLSPAGIEAVGCIVLEDPFFFDRSAWVEAPGDWAPNIVQGKTYDAESEVAQTLLNDVAIRRSGLALADESPEVPGDMFGDPAFVRRRLGQGAFQVLVTDAYHRRCAVSGERALPVLQAAQIRPVSKGGPHQVSNGLLLRSDIHTLFDRRYATITPAGEFRASRHLKIDYDNGAPYYALERSPVLFPRDPADRPSIETLQWHNDEVFLA
jgi:putative restriction endonuclease